MHLYWWKIIIIHYNDKNEKHDNKLPLRVLTTVENIYTKVHKNMVEQQIILPQRAKKK